MRTAFEKYLLTLSKNDAVEHVMDCIMNGPPHNLAWELLNKTHGTDWGFEETEELRVLAQRAVIKLRERGDQ